MRNISLFVEDRGHEVFLQALISRLAQYYRITVRMSFVAARGGHGRVITKLKEYVNDLQDDQEDLPDLLVVATDGNCKGYQGRKQEIDVAIKGFSIQVIYAIPDPHIERWLLLDSTAFKKVLGKGCSAPAQKCERALYKRLLKDAVLNAGARAPLGGIEYAEALVNEMNIEKLEQMEASLGKLLKDLRHQFQQWKRAEQNPVDTSSED